MCLLSTRGQATGTPEQRAGIAQAHTLDQGKGRRRQAFEQTPASLTGQPCLAALRQVVILRGIPAAVADLQLRCQQPWQLRASGGGAQRRVGDGQAEEAGKTTGLKVRTDLLQSAAQGFRAHIDAEEKLGQRCLRQRGRFRPAECLLQLFLPGQLVGPLPHLQGLPGSRGWLLQAGLPGRAPALPAALPIALAIVHQPLPGGADGQQLQSGRVILPLQVGLPALVRTPGGPPQAAQQQAVEPGRPVLSAQPEALHRGLKRRVGLQRQLGNAPVQVAAVNEYAQPSVCQHAAAPGLVQPGAGFRAPVGLFVVEPGGAALANLLGDQHWPTW